jgi:hypothetical protein
MGAAEERLLIYINSSCTTERSDTEGPLRDVSQDADSSTRRHRRMDASRMTRQDLEEMKWGLLPSALA